MTQSASQAVAGASVRRPRRSFPTLVRSGFGDMLSRRRLTRYLVGADLKRTHADTVFGQLWWILDPLLQMLVYWILVGVIFGKLEDDFPLFLFVTILPWKWFSTTLNDAALSVTSRQGLVRQIAFPKIVLPTSSVVAGLVSFGFGLLALAFVYLFFLHRLSPWILLLPLIAGVQFVFTLALAVLVAAANAFYRDVQNVIRHVIRLWFYLSPVLYSLDRFSEGSLIQVVLSLNPFAPILGAYRAVTWGTSAPDWTGLLIILAVSLVFLAVAVGLFKRVEPAFAKIL